MIKLYSVAFFLVIVNVSIALLCNTGLLPVEISTIQITEENFSSAVPSELSYSNSDIAIFVFGDVPRGIAMLGKLFFFAPITLTLLLNEAGLNTAICGLIGIAMWIVYLVGIAQLVMKTDI